jgi:tripartite-type tricarboxylate transporter receptor subunit TctC
LEEENMKSRISAIALSVSLVASAALLLAPSARAQNFPTKPIRMLVAFGAGGFSDVEARRTAEGLQKALNNNPVIIENRPGAGGMIAADATYKADPDGHTLLFVGASISTLKTLNKNLPFDPVTELAPVSMTIESVSLMASNPTLPVKNLREFVAYAKANSGKLNYASAGRNSTMLIFEALKYQAGIAMTEIPFPGEAQYLLAMMRNDVQIATFSLSTATPQVTAGGIRHGIGLSQPAVHQLVWRDGARCHAQADRREDLRGDPQLPHVRRDP